MIMRYKPIIGIICVDLGLTKFFCSLQFLIEIFENVNGTLNVIEDDLCECSAPTHPVPG